MALERLKAELLSEHQETVTQLEAQWTEEKETEIQLQVAKQLTSAIAAAGRASPPSERYTGGYHCPAWLHYWWLSRQEREEVALN